MLDLGEQLGVALKTKGLTISAAESCTGGLLLSRLTDVSGSSAYVMGGIVSYSNEAKMKFLGVQETTLASYGAVSEETSREMVLGVQRAFGTDLALSVTGIAGPGGGTAEKPVGLVFIGALYREKLEVRRFLWQGNRVENKAQSVEAALRLALELL